MYDKVLSEKIKIKSFPNLILICGPTRSGTTALSNIFIQAGIESHMQPIKSILRACADSDERLPTWNINGSSDSIILSKETIGAKAKFEFFNPVDILIKLGYPKEKLIPILIVRSPEQTYCSWQELWGSFKNEYFVLSFQKMEEIKEYCEIHDIKYIPYVNEAIKNNDSAAIARKVFELSLGHAIPSKDLVNWENTPKFGDECPENSHVYFYDVPPPKFIDGVRNRGAFVYEERKATKEARSFSQSQGDVVEIYNAFLRQCEEDLDIVV